MQPEYTALRRIEGDLSFESTGTTNDPLSPTNLSGSCLAGSVPTQVMITNRNYTKQNANSSFTPRHSDDPCTLRISAEWPIPERPLAC
jgi:hypothetical protein